MSTKSHRTYAEKLRDPRWQKKRLQVLEAAQFTCQSCGAKDQELHVHHPAYRKGADPWDYDNLVCLCARCHESIERTTADINIDLSMIPAKEADDIAKVISMAINMRLAIGKPCTGIGIIQDMWTLAATAGVPKEIASRVSNRSTAYELIEVILATVQENITTMATS